MMLLQKDERNLLINTLMLYILQVSKFVFPLLTFPYLTRVLQPEKYGIMTFGNAIIAYFVLLVDFGFLQSATRDCSKNRDNKLKLSEIVSETTASRMVLSILGFIVLVLLSLFRFFEEREIYILISYIMVFLGVFNVDYLFRGIEKMSIITFKTLLTRVIYTSLIFLIIKKPSHYIFIPVISSIGEIVILVWTWYYVKRKLKLVIRFSNLRSIIASLKVSFMFFISRVASTAYSSTNIVVLGFIYNDTKLALFGVANSLIINLRSLFGPISDSLYPYMIKHKNFGLVKRTLIILMPIIIIGTVGLYYFSDLIILIFAGEEYRGAIPIFQVMLPLIIITLPVYLFGFPMLGAMDKMKDANLSVLLAAIFHIISIIFLYSCNLLNFISVSILTVMTELFVLIYRIVCIKKVLIGNKAK